MKKKYIIKDEFRGDDAHLCECIKALIEMSDDGILIPHGIGGHARTMLAASYHRLKNRTAKSRQNAKVEEPAGSATSPKPTDSPL